MRRHGTKEEEEGSLKKEETVENNSINHSTIIVMIGVNKLFSIPFKSFISKVLLGLASRRQLLQVK